MDLPPTIAGFSAWGGNPPSAEPGADGMYWGRNERGADGLIYYAVYRQGWGGEIALLWRSASHAGQGEIEVSPALGQLRVSLYPVEGDKRAAHVEVVSGYTPFPLPQSQAPAPLSPEDRATLDWAARLRAVLAALG